MEFCGVRRVAAVGVALMAGLGLLSGVAPAAQAPIPGRVCQQQRLSVSLRDGWPQDQQVYAQLCLPAGQHPATVLLAIHGITYDHTYWDLPEAPANSFVTAATNAGYATLTIDRLGDGASSHPLGTLLGLNTSGWVAHQVAQALRHGGVTSSTGPVRFDHLIEVGHSYGSGTIWNAATRWPSDADAEILTGAN